MHYNACAENAFESSCSGWWTKIAAAPYFLDRTWPLNQYAYKNKYYSKLRHHHFATRRKNNFNLLEKKLNSFIITLQFLDFFSARFLRKKKSYLYKFGQSTKNNKIRTFNLLKMALTPEYFFFA